MSSKSWFLLIENQIFGPFPESSLQGLVQLRRLHGTDYAWCEGMSHWERLYTLSPFSRFFSAALFPLPQIEQTPSAPTRPVAPQSYLPHKRFIEREPRVDLKSEVILAQGDRRYAVLNFSESGLLFEVGDEVNALIGQETKFTFVIKNKPFNASLTGVLVRESTKPKNVVAIEFTRMNPKIKRELKQIVDEELARQKKVA